MSEKFGLAVYDRARSALDRAGSLGEVKTIRDQAEAMAKYLKQQRAGRQLQNMAAELKLRAERRAGEMLGEMGVRPGNPQLLHDATISPRLVELGISRVESHRWQLAASVPADAFECYVAETKARGDELTSAALIRLAKDRQREDVRGRNRELVEAAPPASVCGLGGRCYQTIVIDPPWQLDGGGDNCFGRGTPPYALMPLEQIAALPMGTLAAADAHLYMWSTNRALPQSFGLLERWGFRYVTVLTWVKPSFGMGNHFRGSTEHVLFGVRGSLPLLRRDVATHFFAPRPGPHSGKPDEFYRLVETCSPGPWLEMFARKSRPGWVVWGAEVRDALDVPA